MGFKGIMKRWLEEGLQNVVGGSADPRVPLPRWVSPLPLLWGWNSLNKVCGWLLQTNRCLPLMGKTPLISTVTFSIVVSPGKKKSQICGRIRVLWHTLGPISVAMVFRRSSVISESWFPLQWEEERELIVIICAHSVPDAALSILSLAHVFFKTDHLPHTHTHSKWCVLHVEFICPWWSC